MREESSLKNLREIYYTLLNIHKSLWYNALVTNREEMISVQELYHRLLIDLRKVGITVVFNLELRPYSKTYYGRYDPNVNKVTLYVYEDKACTKMTKYEELLMTLIHEAVHCIQWHDKSFVRRKGVMHDAEFHRLFNMYKDKAKSILLLREIRHDRIYSAHRGKAIEVHCRHGV